MFIFLVFNADEAKSFQYADHPIESRNPSQIFGAENRRYKHSLVHTLLDKIKIKSV
jgi:hypothetical protein